MRKILAPLSALALMAPLTAGAALADDVAADADQPTAVAMVMSSDGAEIGQVTAMWTPSEQMHVKIDLHGLEAGTHAVHIHETGACEPTPKAAGGHLAMDKAHGVMDANGPHPGDFPNIHIPEGGSLTVEYFNADLTPDMLMDEDGSAFIIHAGTDDYSSQPSGDAGDRVGCGVFKAAQ